MPISMCKDADWAKCSAGYYHGNFKPACCLQCPDNTVTGEVGEYSSALDCPCNKGYYQSLDTVVDGVEHDVYCTPCDAGTFNSSTGATSCSTCPAGTFSEAGASSCSICVTDKASSATGATSCTGCWQDENTGAWTRYDADLDKTIGPLSYATAESCLSRATYDENQLIEGKVGPLPGAYVNIQGGGMCPTSMIGVCNDPCRYRAVRWEATSYDPISGSTQTRTADEDRKIPADTPNFQLTSWPIYHNENTKLLFGGKFEPKDGDNGDWLGQEMKWDMDLTDTEDPYQSIFFGQDTHDPKSSWSQYGPYKTDAKWNEGVTNWLSGDDGLEDDGVMRSRGSYWKMRGCASESGQTYTDDSMFYNNCLEPCQFANQSCECSDMNAGTKDGFRVLGEGEGQNGWWGLPVGSRVSGLSRKPPSHGIWAGTPLVCQKATDTQKGGCFLEDP
jgi:hypothetical protein